MRSIIRIQSAFRGALTRKWVYQVYGFVTRERGDPNQVVYYQQPNYENQLVQSIKDQLGDFNYSPGPSYRDGVKRSQR